MRHANLANLQLGKVAIALCCLAAVLACGATVAAGRGAAPKARALIVIKDPSVGCWTAWIGSDLNINHDAIEEGCSSQTFKVIGSTIVATKKHPLGGCFSQPAGGPGKANCVSVPFKRQGDQILVYIEKQSPTTYPWPIRLSIFERGKLIYSVNSPDHIVYACAPASFCKKSP